MVATADNEFKLLVNGRPALQGDDWNRLYRADIAALLHPGRNVLAVEGVNKGGPAGLLLQAKITLGGKDVTLATDGTWRCSTTASEGWQTEGFDDRGWTAAADLGAPPTDPWGNIGEPGL